MKRMRMLCMALSLTSLLLLSSSLVSAREGRSSEMLEGGWRFFYAGEDALSDAMNSDYDDASWEEISLPHTWNAIDAQDGGNDYARGYGWYRLSLPWEEDMAESRTYLKFYGASLLTDVYVNGEAIFHHEGAYTAFTCDITDYLVPGEEAQIAVCCDNRKTEDVAPQGGDFSLQGGLYRRVELIKTAPVHVDMENYGSNGLFLTTTDVSEEAATLTVRSDIVNDSDEEQTVTVTALLQNPDSFEAISAIENPAFDVASMAPGGEVATESESLTIPAGETATFEKTFTVENPRLWNGKADPYRYETVLTVSADDATLDSVSDYVGFRYFTIDADMGLFLNGEPYQLHGVSRHQDVKDKGYAISLEDHERDFGLIYELGANAIRLAHYPHDPWFYDLCDRYGLVVWAEIPHVGGSLDTDAFRKNLRQQLIELIRQQYNRPAIFFWALQNEIKDPEVVDTLELLNETAHEEDPTRLTTQAIERDNPPIYPTDVVAYNIYPNWYYEGSIADMMDKAYALEDERPIGISEYGAGASIVQHEENAQLSIGQSRGQWHPEEFQSNWHEIALQQLSGRDYIWCNFIWNMFDFASDGKAEGGQLGINDKGLMTHDRQTKKDAFYLYKANWNKEDLFVHLTSARYDIRDYEMNEVKVYANVNQVTLNVNGTDYGTQENDGFGVFKWENVPFEMGENVLVATADSGESDTCTITRILSHNPVLSTELSDIVIDNANHEITLNGSVLVSDFLAATTGENGTVFTLEDENGAEPAGEEKLSVLMKVTAISQDEEVTETYTFVEPNLAAGVEATATTTLGAHPLAYLNDMNGKTYWSSDRGGKATVDLDLAGEYNLTDITIDWLNNGMNERAYLYTIEGSMDGENYTMLVDKSENTEAVPSTGSLRITDALGDARARYLRIDVVGGPNWSECVEINEVQINGFDIASDTYAIDHEAHTISLEKPADTLAWETFEEGLRVTGTSQGITTETGAYYVSSGDLYIVISSDGAEHPYTVLFE